jgi:hypothetical protein
LERSYECGNEQLDSIKGWETVECSAQLHIVNQNCNFNKRFPVSGHYVFNGPDEFVVMKSCNDVYEELTILQILF